MGQDQETPFVSDSRFVTGDNFEVEQSFSDFKENLGLYFEESFSTLPEASKFNKLKLIKYIENNHRSLVFVPKQDLHLFPTVITAAEQLIENHGKSNDKLTPRVVMEHEYEHIKKLWELNLDFTGVGFVLFKVKGKPEFGGFVSFSEKDMKTKELVQIVLAPKNPSEGDWMLAAKKVFQNNSVGEIIKTISDPDIVMLLEQKIVDIPIVSALNEFLETNGA